MCVRVCVCVHVGGRAVSESGSQQPVANKLGSPGPRGTWSSRHLSCLFQAKFLKLSGVFYNSQHT